MTEKSKSRKPDERQEKILITVRDFCRENDLFGGCRAVYAGVSGGADSVCLLFILQRLFSRMPEDRRPSLTAVHVHHGIRGAEADRDAEFTRRLCAGLGVAFVMKRVDAPAFAREKKLSLEEAARQLRYAALREAADGNPIAVAHTASDQAETLLFRLARGTGVRGLAGMSPKTGDICRPLLCLTRQDTEAFLLAEGQPFVTDSTNFGRDNARSILRADVLPGLTEVNSQAVRHIARTAEELAQAEELIRALSRDLLEKAGRDAKSGILLDIRTLKAAPKIVGRRAVLSALIKSAGHERDIQAVHVQAVCDLMNEETGARVCLPYGVQVRREYDCLHFFRGEPAERKARFAPQALGGKDREELENGGKVIKFFGPWRAEFVLVPKFARDEDNEFTKFFDYDKMKHELLLRNVAENDFMQTGRQSRAALVKVFRDRKISQEQRGEVPLVAAGSEVYWAVGVRRSQAALIDEQTRRILRLSVARTD